MSKEVLEAILFVISIPFILIAFFGFCYVMAGIIVSLFRLDRF